MQVKVFESPDMATGLRMVRNELGADALILSTRSIRNSKLGLLGKSMLEITAAIDETPPSSRSNSDMWGVTNAKQVSTTPFYRKKKAASVTSRASDNLFSLVPSSTPLQAETSQDVVTNKSRESASSDINGELDELKSMIRSLSDEVSRLKPIAKASIPTQATRVDISTTVKKPTRTENTLVNMLESYGISPETAQIVADLAADALSEEDLANQEQLVAFFQEIIAGFIQVSPLDFTENQPQKRIAFVGPTGVGKTTTLAKLAALCIGKFRQTVALITIDTYRIAAVEQLKVYGEIMGLPVDVVLTPHQFKKAIDNHRDKDVILIDTAGRSPRDKMSIEELATFFAEDLGIEKHLVLSAGTRDLELIEAVSHFQKLNLDKTIFTKIDECTNLGVILNTQLSNPTPLSYITNGQRVPEDLLEIDRETVAKLVIPPTQGSAS